MNPNPAVGQYPYPSKVDLRFDHWYDYEAMTEALHDLAEAYPELLTLESIGKSVAGRDLWLMTLNNPETGPDSDKTAMFIDANIHGNEIQGAETVLYSIWYLTKSHGKIERLTKLIDERAFYFLPMENPDGREVWFDEPATPNYLRGGVHPTDNDYDGLFDEDPPDDLDGDGHITGMWKADPLGRWKRDPDDERFFIRTPSDKPPGGWTYVGQEGIDNDGDGQINEDGPGGYDPNRNWPSDWQPNYIQYGAGEYPFSLPETRAIGEFLLAHPNIAAYQSYHNAGGMILAGPGAAYISYPRQDVRVLEALQETGAQMIPFYRPMVIHADLYTV
ncbi:MAG: M14 family metallopeptidase, partial [Planctomycetota bacterium]